MFLVKAAKPRLQTSWTGKVPPAYFYIHNKKIRLYLLKVSTEREGERCQHDAGSFDSHCRCEHMLSTQEKSSTFVLLLLEIPQTSEKLRKLE